jgi:hypothetical protein
MYFMKNKTAGNYDDRVKYAVAFLQEFYDSRDLHKFYHLCDRGGWDVCEVFLGLAKYVQDSFAELGSAPNWQQNPAKYLPKPAVPETQVSARGILSRWLAFSKK